jgi:hypothetical protein
MNTLNANKAGLALGSVIAGWHVLWSLLVIFGWAQFVIDWIFRFHYIQPLYIVTGFDPMMALGLIIVTFVLGYAMGWVFATIWNKLHKS